MYDYFQFDIDNFKDSDLDYAISCKTKTKENEIYCVTALPGPLEQKIY